MKRLPFLLAALVALPLGAALAADQPITLGSALKLAFSQGPGLASQLATLENARAILKSREADPSTLILELTGARQGVALETAYTAQKRLQVLNDVTVAYLALYEGQERVKLLEAQVALNARYLEVAKTKLAAKNGTALEVSQAQNTLAASQQSLSDARAQLPILSNRLEPLMALPTNSNLVALSVPEFKERKLDLSSLESGLSERLPSVVQAAQAVDLAQLNVRLADNEYTAAGTLRDAKATLANAERTLETTRKTALTDLRDAYRAVTAALEKVSIARKDLENASATLAQDQARFKSGTISAVALQASQVSLASAKHSALQATDTYLKALADLSVNAGVDTTGLVAASAGGET